MTNRKMKYSLALCALMLIAVSASAHVGGFTYEASKDGYFIDVGANKLELNRGELILFEYNLYKNDNPNLLADFDSVYVTVGDSKSLLLSTYIHRPGDMLTVMSFAFPGPGNYVMSARFQKDGNVLVEAEFPVSVGGGLVTDSLKFAIIGLIGGVGLCLGLNLFKRKKSSHVTELQ